MRKMVALLGVLALLAVAHDALAAPTSTYLFHFRRNLAARSTPIDSTFANFAAGAAQDASAETTAAIPTADIDFDNPTGVAFTTAQPFGRVFLYSDDTAIAGDSLYLATDYSPDGKNWGAGAYVGMATVTASDKFAGVSVTIDADAAGANLWRMPFVRFRIWGDSGGVKNANLRGKLVAPTWTDRGPR